MWLCVNHTHVNKTCQLTLVGDINLQWLVTIYPITLSVMCQTNLLLLPSWKIAGGFEVMLHAMKVTDTGEKGNIIMTWTCQRLAFPFSPQLTSRECISNPGFVPPHFQCFVCTCMSKVKILILIKPIIHSTSAVSIHSIPANLYFHANGVGVKLRNWPFIVMPQALALVQHWCKKASLLHTPVKCSRTRK